MHRKDGPVSESITLPPSAPQTHQSEYLFADVKYRDGRVIEVPMKHKNAEPNDENRRAVQLVPRRPDHADREQPVDDRRRPGGVRIQA